MDPGTSRKCGGILVGRNKGRLQKDERRQVGRWPSVGHHQSPYQDLEFHLRITVDLQGFSWQEKGVLVFAVGEVSLHGERWMQETGNQGREY